jgi:hypothetical protein
MQTNPTVQNFKLLNSTLIYNPFQAKIKHYPLPRALRPMVLEYFHNSIMSAHLGMTKKLNPTRKVFLLAWYEN